MGQYKAEVLCETNSQTMSFYCEKTCEFCKCYDNPAVKYDYLKKAKACENKDNMARMKLLCPSTCDSAQLPRKPSKPILDSATCNNLWCSSIHYLVSTQL